MIILFVLTVITMTVAVVWQFLPDKHPVYPASDHYDPVSKKFHNHVPQQAVKGVIPLLWEMAVNPQKYRPNQRLPSVQPDWQTFQTASDRAKFIWFGHSTLLMNSQQQNIAFDPVFADSVSPLPIMMKRFQPAVASIQTFPALDVVLISHNHYDHLEEKTIRHLAQTTPIPHFIVPLGLGVTLKKWGITEQHITELDWWQTIDYQGIQYTAVPARHDSGRKLTDRFQTLWAGYIIETKNERFYFSGDTSYGEHFAQIAQRFPHIDIAFIENGQYNEHWPDNHLFPEQTATVATTLKPKRFMPIHWGAYPIALHSWNDSVTRSIPLVRAQSIQPLTPIQGAIFDSNSETTDWFTSLSKLSD